MTLEVLEASRVLKRFWRVAYLEADNEITARKPLLFWNSKYAGKEIPQQEIFRVL